MTTTIVSGEKSAPVKRDQAPTKINFVQPATIIDRDFVVAGRIKLLGMIFATLVTSVTTAIFLFM